MSSTKIIIKQQGPPSKVKSTADMKTKDISPTKVIVRRLPPSLTAESFLEEVSPLPEHNYFNFVTADKSLGQYGFCKAFINFKNADDLYIFREQFDNYVFVDARGNEYPALVEYAPYQKVPLRQRKADHRENTLDNDTDFIKFMEVLENPEVLPTLSVKEVLEEIEAKAKERLAAQNSETPLLAFINKFKIEKKRAQEKLKEERRLQAIEKKRLKDEEKRLRKERERRELAESSKNKDNVSVKQLPSSSAVGDRKLDAKKSINKGEAKPFSTPSKASARYAGEPKGASSAGGKASDKPSKYGSVHPKQSKDEIIVRTLPSAKYKSSKVVAEKSRPASSKPAPSQAKGAAPASQSKTTPPAGPKPATEGDKKETSSYQKAPAGKQQVAVLKPSVGASPKPATSAAEKPRPRDQTADQKATAKGQPDKTGGEGPEKSRTASTEELTSRMSAVKVREKGNSAAGYDTTKPETKRYSKSTPSARLDRSTSEDINSSETRPHDSAEIDGEKSRPVRNTRYKDRPERAIYNPAAKAAERRQRQQAMNTAKTSSSDNKVD